MVHVYSLDKENPLEALYSHFYAIKSNGNQNACAKMGAVCSLDWTSDGYALAVGWTFGGFAVFSLYGCQLTSTISEDTFIYSSYLIYLFKRWYYYRYKGIVLYRCSTISIINVNRSFGVTGICCYSCYQSILLKRVA